MVQQRRLSGRKQMGNHNRDWIWGRHLVISALRAGRWLPHEVLMSNDLTPAVRDDAVSICDASHIPFEVVARATIEAACRSRDHQGLAARMPAFPYNSLESLVKESGPSAIALLDRIQDPFNLGAIIRSAEIFAWDGLIICPTGQAEVSSQVARSSAGAINLLPLASVNNLLDAAALLRRKQYRLVAASEKSKQPIDTYCWPARTVLILGNEGSGPSKELLEICDDLVAIPQFGTTPSLNVGASAAILFHDWRRSNNNRPPGQATHNDRLNSIGG